MKLLISLISATTLLSGCASELASKLISVTAAVQERKDPLQIEQKDAEQETVSTQEQETQPATLLDVPLILQNPELERGCEVTSLAMMLQYAGLDAGKMQLAKEIKKVPFYDGNYRGNPNEGFVGDIYTIDKPGIGVFNGPIEDLAEQYLPGRIVNLTGQSFSAVTNQLDKGKPVWVIVTSWYSYVPENQWRTWSTSEGNIQMTYNMHSVLITGYDDDHLYINDPFGGKNKKVDKKNFIDGWEQFGSQAISYN